MTTPSRSQVVSGSHRADDEVLAGGFEREVMKIFKSGSAVRKGR
ncbi:unnamed protein product [[Actinomadura] parvosata subsp. kistnae]|nr:unnamed protein product [Actinomadura parvosata subsp. kistnae]